MNSRQGIAVLLAVALPAAGNAALERRQEVRMMHAPAELRFRHVVVDPRNPKDPHCKAAGDIDGDGLPDLLAASASGEGLFWYRTPNWTKHRIADGSFTTDMAVSDVDGDGHLDIVIPAEAGLLWFRNPRGEGKDPAGPWAVTNLGPAGASMHDVEIADLNGDRKLDVVSRHQSGFGKRLGNAIHLWVQRSLSEWEHHSFPCPHGEGLKVADLNRDGRPDVVIGGRWYENPGDPLRGEWKEHRYLSEESFSAHWTNGDVVAQVGDLNGDGRPDIALSPAEGTGRLSWFAAPEDPRRPDWREDILEERTDHSHGLALGDLDGEGRMDLVCAKMHQATAPQEVRLYRNPGGEGKWAKQVIATTGSHNIVLVDVNRDGRLDLFGANWNNSSATGGVLELWIQEAT